jgi:transcription initiation factor TFIID subunit 3
MAVHYTHHILRVAVAQICQQLGWDAVNSTSLELITCILERYVYDLGQKSHRYAELCKTPHNI